MPGPLKFFFYFLPAAFLFSCGTEKIGQENKDETPPLKNAPVAYSLDADMSRFIGNDAVPDFKFNPQFISEHQIKNVICFERAVACSKPADTLRYKPRYIWVFDSAGVAKELHFFGADKEKLHSEYYLNESEIKYLALRGIDVERSAVTVYKYRDSLSRQPQNLVQEIRTEPESADTTTYYYSNGLADSLKVSAFNGAGFYIKFYRYKNGVLKQRLVKETGKKEIVKNWLYKYNAAGNVIEIEETNEDGGVYSFNWDLKGRIAFIDYKQKGQLLFSKTMTYDDEGFLKSIVLDDGMSKRILDYIYEERPAPPVK
jgi:YD repeat-containing protein